MASTRSFAEEDHAEIIDSIRRKPAHESDYNNIIYTYIVNRKTLKNAKTRPKCRAFAALEADAIVISVRHDLLRSGSLPGTFP